MPEIRPVMTREWFERYPLLVAWDLVGAVLTVERDGTRTSGRIVEAEAYAGPEDLAAHSGMYKAAKPLLFGEIGRLYMYRCYGIHTMLNIVAHQPDLAGAVLIRALEPLAGEPIIFQRRGREMPYPLRGPGALCRGMDLRLTDNGLDLLDSSEIRLELGEPAKELIASPRIGISRSTQSLWRLFEPDNRHVSASRKGHLIQRGELDLHFPPVGEIVP